MKTYKRNSTYELLRIIAMFMIVINHFAMFIQPDFSNFKLNYFFNYLFQTGGKFGVNLFMLITGYFLCESTFRKEKLIGLLLKCSVFSIGCYGVYAVVTRLLSVKSLISSAFPCITNEYWFITAYIGVYLLCPYINILFHALTKIQRRNLTIILTVMFSIIPTFTLQETWTSNFVWLAFLYWIGAFVRHDLPERIRMSRLIFPISCILYMGITFSCIVIDYVSRYVPVLSYHVGHFRNMTSFPLLLSSVLLFVCFGNITINPNSKLVPSIMTLAKGAFGVCLIHENPYIKNFLWKGVLAEITPNGAAYFLFAILASAVIYLTCTVIDFVINKMLDYAILSRFVR